MGAAEDRASRSETIEVRGVDRFTAFLFAPVSEKAKTVFVAEKKEDVRTLAAHGRRGG
jgi:hypothetical protein